MNARLNETWKKYKLVLMIVVGIVVAYFVIQMVVNERLEDLQSQIKIQISEQETVLATIAETTARNGADAITESVVRDCTVDERGRFDALLGNLDKGLSVSDLTELERLFGRCGSFYAERKSVMVARLTREIEVYDAYVAQLDAVSDADVVNEYKVPTWKNLAAEEQKQSELFSKMVNLQDQIIQTLLSGKQADSEEIAKILQDVSTTQQTLLVANKQAANIRSELVSL